MASEPLILGFDTSAAHCAAALLCGGRVLACASESMTRGQAERLMPLIEEVLAQGGAGWRDLDGIGVGIGPGNFTGIRISVSAARGLSLSLGIPAVGVSSFAAISNVTEGVHLPCVPAPREQVYVQEAGQDPRLVALADAQALGTALAMPPAPDALAVSIAQVALARGLQHGPPPAPLYIRAADAAPGRDTPPVILDDA